MFKKSIRAFSFLVVMLGVSITISGCGVAGILPMIQSIGALVGTMGSLVGGSTGAKLQKLGSNVTQVGGLVNGITNIADKGQDLFKSSGLGALEGGKGSLGQAVLTPGGDPDSDELGLQPGKGKLGLKPGTGAPGLKANGFDLANFGKSSQKPFPDKLKDFSSALGNVVGTLGKATGGDLGKKLNSFASAANNVGKITSNIQNVGKQIDKVKGIASKATSQKKTPTPGNTRGTTSAKASTPGNSEEIGATEGSETEKENTGVTKCKTSGCPNDTISGSGICSDCQEFAKNKAADDKSATGGISKCSTPGCPNDTISGSGVCSDCQEHANQQKGSGAGSEVAENKCAGCGASIGKDLKYCETCATDDSGSRFAGTPIPQDDPPRESEPENGSSQGDAPLADSEGNGEQP